MTRAVWGAVALLTVLAALVVTAPAAGAAPPPSPTPSPSRSATPGPGGDAAGGSCGADLGCWRDELIKKLHKCMEDLRDTQECLRRLGQKVPTPPTPGEVVSSGVEGVLLKPLSDGISSLNRTLVRIMVLQWLYQDSIRLTRSGVVVTRDEGASAKGVPSSQDCTTITTPPGELVPGTGPGTLTIIPPCTDGAASGGGQEAADSVHTTNTVGLQSVMLGVGLIIASGLLILQGVRTALTRKGAPLLEALRGLMVLAVMAALGVAVVDTLLVASDALTRAILDSGLGDGLRGRVDGMLTGVFVLAPVPAILLGCVLFAISLVQLIVLFFRQAAIPVLAMLIPVAASGQVGGGTARQFQPRLWGMIFAVIVYKPAAALIFAVGFLEVGQGKGLWDFVRGVVTLVLAIIALPLLMKLFTPIVGQAVGGDGGFVSGFFTMLSAVGGARDLVGGLSGGGKGGGEVDAADPTSYATYGDSDGDGTDGPGDDAPPHNPDEAEQQQGRPGADDAAAVAGPEAAAVQEAGEQAKEQADEARERVGQAGEAFAGSDGIGDTSTGGDGPGPAEPQVTHRGGETPPDDGGGDQAPPEQDQPRWPAP